MNICDLFREYGGNASSKTISPSISSPPMANPSTPVCHPNGGTIPHHYPNYISSQMLQEGGDQHNQSVKKNNTNTATMAGAIMIPSLINSPLVRLSNRAYMSPQPIHIVQPISIGLSSASFQPHPLSFENANHHPSLISSCHIPNTNNNRSQPPQSLSLIYAPNFMASPSHLNNPSATLNTTIPLNGLLATAPDIAVPASFNQGQFSCPNHPRQYFYTTNHVTPLPSIANPPQANVTKIKTSPGSDSPKNGVIIAKARKEEFNSKAKASPRNNSNYCETCEKAFQSAKHYQTHLSKHEHCQYENCTYHAIPPLLKLHHMLHERNMLASLDSPEEIERYRTERKKRYPTRAKHLAREINQVDPAASLSTNFVNHSNSVPSDLSNNDSQPQDKIILNIADDKKKLQGRRRANAIDGANQKSSLENEAVTPFSDPSPEKSHTGSVEKMDIEPRPDVIHDHEPISASTRRRKALKSSDSSQFIGSRSKRSKLSSQDKTSGSSLSNSNTKATSVTKSGRQSILKLFLQPQVQQERKAILQCLEYMMAHNFLAPNRSILVNSRDE